MSFICLFPKDRPARATRLGARENNNLPCKIVIDKSAANTLVIKDINPMLTECGWPISLGMVRNKHLNGVIEQARRFIKHRVKPMLGFKSFASASEPAIRRPVMPAGCP